MMHPLPSHCSTVHDIARISIKLGLYFYQNYRFDAPTKIIIRIFIYLFILLLEIIHLNPLFLYCFLDFLRYIVYYLSSFISIKSFNYNNIRYYVIFIT